MLSAPNAGTVALLLAQACMPLVRPGRNAFRRLYAAYSSSFKLTEQESVSRLNASTLRTMHGRLLPQHVHLPARPVALQLASCNGRLPAGGSFSLRCTHLVDPLSRHGDRVSMAALPGSAPAGSTAPLAMKTEVDVCTDGQLDDHSRYEKTQTCYDMFKAAVRRSRQGPAIGAAMPYECMHFDKQMAS